ncbi:MAG: hypothetical protein RLZZ293_836 [Pseudomonadota bacterium]|jgi:hypothetical protein
MTNKLRTSLRKSLVVEPTKMTTPIAESNSVVAVELQPSVIVEDVQQPPMDLVATIINNDETNSEVNLSPTDLTSEIKLDPIQPVVEIKTSVELPFIDASNKVDFTSSLVNSYSNANWEQLLETNLHLNQYVMDYAVEITKVTNPMQLIQVNYDLMCKLSAQNIKFWQSFFPIINRI